ncbi:citrate synthase [Ceratobasidium sp. UAMH 11750]|nr:citrate synthase [Ceratobasidium sp. UAMH 11750]
MVCFLRRVAVLRSTDRKHGQATVSRTTDTQDTATACFLRRVAVLRSTDRKHGQAYRQQDPRNRRAVSATPCPYRILRVKIVDVEAEASCLTFAVNASFSPRADIKSQLLASVPAEKQDVLYNFLSRLYSVYVDLHFAYLKINPLIRLDAPPNSPAMIHFLDMAAKLDQTADSICAPKCAITHDPSDYTERDAAVPGGRSSSTAARRWCVAHAVWTRFDQGGGVRPEARR